MLCNYMAKLHAKDDVSLFVSKAAVEDATHISFSATHPLRASGSERNPMDTPNDVHLLNGPEVDAMNDPYSLDGAIAGTSADMDMERGETPLRVGDRGTSRRQLQCRGRANPAACYHTGKQRPSFTGRGNNLPPASHKAN